MKKVAFQKLVKAYSDFQISSRQLNLKKKIILEREIGWFLYVPRPGIELGNLGFLSYPAKAIDS